MVTMPQVTATLDAIQESNDGSYGKVLFQWSLVPDGDNGPLVAHFSFVVPATGEVISNGTLQIYGSEELGDWRRRAAGVIFGSRRRVTALDGSEAIHFKAERFRAKLYSAIEIIQAALAKGTRPYVAFSGGKDSLAVAAIVRRVTGSRDIPMCWSDDELEYTETVDFMQRVARGDNLLVTLGWAQHAGWFSPWRGETHFREPIEGAIRIEQRSEDWYASQGYDLTFTGLRADESARRRGHLYSVAAGLRASAAGRLIPDATRTPGLYHTATGWRCTPLWDWTADDVWALIAGWRLPYNPVYDKLTAIGVPRDHQRVGPLPLARRDHLDEAWPDLYQRLVARYGERWL